MPLLGQGLAQPLDRPGDAAHLVPPRPLRQRLLQVALLERIDGGAQPAERLADHAGHGDAQQQEQEDAKQDHHAGDAVLQVAHRDRQPVQRQVGDQHDRTVGDPGVEGQQEPAMVMSRHLQVDDQFPAGADRGQLRRIDPHGGIFVHRRRRSEAAPVGMEQPLAVRADHQGPAAERACPCNRAARRIVEQEVDTRDAQQAAAVANRQADGNDQPFAPRDHRPVGRTFDHAAGIARQVVAKGTITIGRRRVRPGGRSVVQEVGAEQPGLRMTEFVVAAIGEVFAERVRLGDEPQPGDLRVGFGCIAHPFHDPAPRRGASRPFDPCQTRQAVHHVDPPANPPRQVLGEIAGQLPPLVGPPGRRSSGR